VVITKEEYEGFKKFSKNPQNTLSGIELDLIRQYELRQDVREKIARKLWYFHTGAILSTDDWRADGNKRYEEYLLRTDQILSLVAVLDSDQTLPDYWTTDRLYPEGTNTMRHVFTQEQQKAIIAAGWRKVIL
jgi:hypothetical protein